MQYNFKKMIEKKERKLKINKIDCVIYLDKTNTSLSSLYALTISIEDSIVFYDNFTKLSEDVLVKSSKNCSDYFYNNFNIKLPLHQIKDIIIDFFNECEKTSKTMV